MYSHDYWWTVTARREISTPDIMFVFDSPQKKLIEELERLDRRKSKPTFDYEYWWRNAWDRAMDGMSADASFAQQRLIDELKRVEEQNLRKKPWER